MIIDVEGKLRQEIHEAMQKYQGETINEELKESITADVRRIFVSHRDNMVEYAVDQVLRHFKIRE